jgi:hypothetical protein
LSCPAGGPWRHSAGTRTLASRHFAASGRGSGNVSLCRL